MQSRSLTDSDWRPLSRASTRLAAPYSPMYAAKIYAKICYVFVYVIYTHTSSRASVRLAALCSPMRRQYIRNRSMYANM